MKKLIGFINRNRLSSFLIVLNIAWVAVDIWTGAWWLLALNLGAAIFLAVPTYQLDKTRTK